MKEYEPRKIAILQVTDEMAEVNVVRNTLNHAGLNTRIDMMMKMTIDLTVKKMMRNTTMKKLLLEDVKEAEGIEEDKGKRLRPLLKRGRFCWRDREKDKRVAILLSKKARTILNMMKVMTNDNLAQAIPMDLREGGNRLNIYHLKLLD